MRELDTSTDTFKALVVVLERGKLVMKDPASNQWRFVNEVSGIEGFDRTRLFPTITDAAKYLITTVTTAGVGSSAA